MMHNTFQAKGYLEVDGEFKQVKPSQLHGFDGMKLSSLFLPPVTLTSEKEFEELIEFLKITKHCFWQPKG